MSKRRWTPIAWLLGGLLVAYCYTFISATASDSENLSGCQAIVSAVTSPTQIPTVGLRARQSSRFCELGVHLPLLRTYFTVFIYGVLDRTEQDAILDSLRACVTRLAYARNARASSTKRKTGSPGPTRHSGRSGGSRGPETPILTRWIP